MLTAGSSYRYVFLMQSSFLRESGSHLMRAMGRKKHVLASPDKNCSTTQM